MFNKYDCSRQLIIINFLTILIKHRNQNNKYFPPFYTTESLNLTLPRFNGVSKQTFVELNY